MQFVDGVVRYMRAMAGIKLSSAGHVGQASEFGVDTTTHTMQFFTGGAQRQVADLTADQTFTGAQTFSGAATFTGATAGLRTTVPVTTTAAGPTTLTAAQSGIVIISTAGSSTQTWTLPAAATPGLVYTFVCGGASTEIIVGVATGDNIVGKTHGANDGTGLLSTATTGVLKNTAATNVVGDFCTLVSDGVTTWFMVAVAGVWSVT